MDKALTNVIGFWGQHQGASDTLQGTFKVSVTPDHHMCLLLKALQRPQFVVQTGTTPPDISPQEHHSEWKKQNKGTASAHNALGFHDHKAAIYDSNVAAVDRFSQAIPCKMGFSPMGYQNIMDCQILKKAGMFAVEKMQTIQSMVTAFNVNNKHMGHQAMKQAERLKLLPWEQGGSRKNRRVAHSVVDKVLSLDSS